MYYLVLLGAGVALAGCGPPPEARESRNPLHIGPSEFECLGNVQSDPLAVVVAPSTGASQRSAVSERDRLVFEQFRSGAQLNDTDATRRILEVLLRHAGERRNSGPLLGIARMQFVLGMFVEATANAALAASEARSALTLSSHDVARQADELSSSARSHTAQIHFDLSGLPPGAPFRIDGLPVQDGASRAVNTGAHELRAFIVEDPGPPVTRCLTHTVSLNSGERAEVRVTEDIHVLVER